MKPTKNNVLLKPIRAEKIGSIFLSDVDRRPVMKCEVLGIGRDVIGLTKGDTVLVDRFKGQSAETEDGSLLAMGEHVLVVL